MKIMGIYKTIEERLGSIHTDPDYSINFDLITAKYLSEVALVEQ